MKIKKIVIFALLNLLITPSFLLPLSVKAAEPVENWWESAIIKFGTPRANADEMLKFPITINPGFDGRTDNKRYGFRLKIDDAGIDRMNNQSFPFTEFHGGTHYAKTHNFQSDNNDMRSRCINDPNADKAYLAASSESEVPPILPKFEMVYVDPNNLILKLLEPFPDTSQKKIEVEIFAPYNCGGVTETPYFVAKNKASTLYGVPDPNAGEDKVQKLKDINRLFAEMRDLMFGNDGTNSNSPITLDFGQDWINPFLPPKRPPYIAELDNEGKRKVDPVNKNPFWKKDSELKMAWTQFFRDVADKVISHIAKELFNAEGINLLSDYIEQGWYLTKEGEIRVNAIAGKAQELTAAITEADEMGITTEDYEKAPIMKRHIDGNLDDKTKIYKNFEEFKNQMQKIIDLYKLGIETFLENQDPCESGFLTAIDKRNLAGFMICIVGQFVDNLATFIMEIGLKWIRNGAGL